MKVELKADANSDTTLVVLTGDIVEGVEQDFFPIRQQVKTPKICFDVQKVIRVNSIGIGHWIHFITDLKNKELITFVNCPTVFVDVAAMMPIFLGGGKIISLELEFDCLACKQLTKKITPLGELMETIASPPTCKRCGEAMECSLDEERGELLLDL